VGHLNIGAGRIVYQDLTRIDLSIEEGTFFDNPTLNQAVSRAMEKGSALHLMGLVSDGGVHSQLTHILALLDLAKRRGLTRVFLHAILDGRDTAPDSGQRYVAEVQKHMTRIGTGAIATRASCASRRGAMSAKFAASRSAGSRPARIPGV
jgi:2,3-bisphosphoglycerate-independent phosphoglycerate mutase